MRTKCLVKNLCKPLFSLISPLKFLSGYEREGISNNVDLSGSGITDRGLGDFSYVCFALSLSLGFFIGNYF